MSQWLFMKQILARLRGESRRFNTRSSVTYIYLHNKHGRAIAQAVSRRLPTSAAQFKPRSGHVGFCDEQKWRWGRFSPRTSVSPANLQSTNFYTITIIYHLGLVQ
jgi:hypothetical protein